MLRIAVDWLVLAENAIEHAGRFLIIHLSLFSEVDTADPLVLYLLEGRFDLQQHCQFVELVPENLILAIDVVIFGGFADIG